MKRIIFILGLSLLAVSCIGRFRSPKVTVADSYTFGKHFNTDTININTEWWRTFGDTTLDRLIATAIVHNQSAAQAYLKVKQARLEIGAVRSEFAPAFNLGAIGGAEYEHLTKTVQKYSVTPSMSWEVSLFGGGSYAVKAAKAEYSSSLWSARGVRLELASEVATAYFTLLQYNEMLRISRESYNLRLQLTAITDSMYRHGMSSAVDYQQALSLTATTAADIPMYERAVSETSMTLATLIGINPEQADTTLFIRSLLNASLPENVPVGLPSQLLRRRPDIMQAYYECAMAHAKMGSARAAQFPSIELTADGGVAASTLKGLTGANPWIWNAELSIAEPLLYMGRLNRNYKIAKYGLQEADLEYRAVCIEAFKEVEESLDAIETYKQQVTEYASFVNANAKIQTLTRNLYLDGMSSYLELIDAERTLYSSQLECVQLAAQQYINYVTLYKALGGGW